MGWLILILVLLAAAFGILGAVLKAAAFVVLTVVLSVVLLATVGWYVVKHQARRLMTDVDRRIADERVERFRQDDGGELPPPRDDRY
jgi:peptidoglycan/LPS O-acetylase OafA/YrhL